MTHIVDIKKHLDLLGMRVQDRVTGYKGVVTSVGFDLYGCIQAIVHQGIDKDGKPHEQHWFDVNRLELSSKMPVMNRPTFDYGPAAPVHGPAEKPRFAKA